MMLAHERTCQAHNDPAGRVVPVWSEEARECRHKVHAASVWHLPGASTQPEHLAAYTSQSASAFYLSKAAWQRSIRAHVGCQRHSSHLEASLCSYILLVVQVAVQARGTALSYSKYNKGKAALKTRMVAVSTDLASLWCAELE